ncbi:MAG: permease [Methanohalobium sp.]|uniref:permease n=1 Tax=Methanohalobium sp. TaxID=2837493 RepID=UPI00397CD62B
MQDYIIRLTEIGLASVQEYLALHVIMCLVPAFFLAGAIAALFSKESVLQFFGKDVPKYVSYPIAAVSGTVLAVCSCTVLPLFAGIYRRGAGIGPATAFLFSAPAINILAIVYTAQILGYDLGIARAATAILFSVVIGLGMTAIFERNDTGEKGFTLTGSDEHKNSVRLFILLLAILILPGFFDSLVYSLVAVAPLVAITVYSSLNWFTKDELKSWMSEVWFLVKQIVPLLLVGVFFAGIIVEVLPAEYVARYVGENSITSNLTAGAAAALMYFSTLTEVPIISSLTQLGMGRGPALTMLLAGPALSLPNMIVISRIMGLKKGLTYIVFITVIAAIAGLIFGYLI